MSALPSDPVTLAQMLIRCPSITPLEAGALDLLEEHLTSLGFICRRLKFQEAFSTEVVDNLYARFGTGFPHLCFAGHTDVVPPGDLSLWKVPPFEGRIEEEVLYGRGAVDMKGSIACFVVAVSRFFKRGSFSGSLSFLLTSDEEGLAINGTQKVLSCLKDEGEKIDAFLIGEPTSQDKVGDTLKIGRRGSLNCQLSVDGKQGHTAYSELCYNPIPSLLRCLQTLLKGPEETPSPFFPPTHLEITSIDVDNPISNIIPQTAHARFNIRFNDQHSEISLKAWIRSVCEAHLKQYTLAFSPASEPYLTSPSPFIEIIKNTLRKELGLTPHLSTAGGTSDGRFLCSMAPVIELGLLGRTLHQINEHVSLKDLETLTYLYEILIEKFFHFFKTNDKLGLTC